MPAVARRGAVRIAGRARCSPGRQLDRRSGHSERGTKATAKRASGVSDAPGRVVWWTDEHHQKPPAGPAANRASVCVRRLSGCSFRRKRRAGRPPPPPAPPPICVRSARWAGRVGLARLNCGWVILPAVAASVGLLVEIFDIFLYFFFLLGSGVGNIIVTVQGAAAPRSQQRDATQRNATHCCLRILHAPHAPHALLHALQCTSGTVSGPRPPRPRALFLILPR